MKFRRKSPSSCYLYETGVENIYISEYMAAAPGEYVKVYLLALMYAQMNQEVSNTEMAKQLMIDEDSVRRAWEYWRSLGVVRRGREDVWELISLRESLYGEAETEEEDSGVLSDRTIADMYKSVEKAVGRPLGGAEAMEIVSWIEDFGATPEMILYAYTYCCGTLKKDNVKYVGKVVHEWAMKGLTEIEALDEYIEGIDKKRFLYKRIFKALGFMRNPTEEEKRIMESWFSELGYSVDRILEACSKTAGIANPNIKYVDKVLREWAKERDRGAGQAAGEPTVGTVFKYYDYLRAKSEQQLAERKKEIYSKFPEIADIEKALKEKSMQLSRIMVSQAEDKELHASQINEEIHELIASKAAILADGNYPIDYMDAAYHCRLCKDTGKTENGERCECFAQRAEEAKEWQNSIKMMKTT